MKRLLCLLAACGGGSTNITTDAPPASDLVTLSVPVPAYVALATPAISDQSSWDLHFDGFSVLTNSGISGTGAGGAFGPLDPASFDDDTAPVTPFISADKQGGAFLDWYAYDGTQHVLFSKFHVYAVKSGGTTYKVQLLTYYGVVDGAPTSAMYQIRFAPLGGATQTISVDGTAGGLAGTGPSGCLTLATGAVALLDDPTTSTAWDVCFKRDAIRVRETGADLNASDTADLATVKTRTADSEQPAFAGVSSVTATLQPDHVVSAFETGDWTHNLDQAWLVIDASGFNKFLVNFEPFENPTTSSPGTVVMHVKPVK